MKKSLIVGVVSIVAAGLFFSSQVWARCTADQFGLCNTANNAGLDKQTSVTEVTGNVIGTALSMVAVVFFGLMIYGGVMWMVDRGNEERAKKALDTIIAAVIGLIIILGSYAITKFVFSSVGSSSGGVGSAPTATTTSTGTSAP